MTTEVQARDALASAVDTFWKASQFSDVKLYSTSGPQPQVDVDTRFIQYEILVEDSDQASIGDKPLVRNRGRLVFNFAAKVGGGTGERALLVMRQDTRHYFDATHFSVVETEEVPDPENPEGDPLTVPKAAHHTYTLIPRPRRDPTLPGWIVKSLEVPFYFDEQST